MSQAIDQEGLKSSDARASRSPVQRRGQLRVDAILDAAEAVFSEMGVDAATTNAIAERAGSSVGSLYHFFANKDAILVALTERYGETMRAVLRRERRIDEPWVPLADLFRGVVAAFGAIEHAHPGYMAVCRATDSASGGKSAASLQTEAHMQDMVVELLEQRCPGIPAEEARVHAVLSVVTMHAALDQIQSMPESARPAVSEAVIEMMVRYFTPVEARYPRAELPQR
jgi:AcrR family transcriptional regulator